MILFLGFFVFLRGVCNYRHIAINLATSLSFATANGLERIFCRESEELTQRCFVSAEQTLQDIQLYFQLLRRFPDYREAEFATTEGFFPDPNFRRLKEVAGNETGDVYVHASRILLEQ